MIAKSTIDQVYETARVEEVIGDFVQLKKSGTNFKGLSPFSQERTPSFMVSPVKQIWKDFSSGKGGNVVAFLMEHERFTYPEAIKYLAKKYAIEIEETEQSDEQKALRDARESMHLVAEYACTYFQKNLLETETGKAIGGTYFKERGFTAETIKAFDLGYALPEKDAFSRTAIKQGYALEYLEKTGLTIVNEDRNIDRFRGRVMFPIKSMAGRVLGFGGRILGENKKVAKYLNSPESDIYHKSKVLYGLYEAKQSIAKADCCYLVEGYTDVIQLHQRGITNVVSSSGTALTEGQIRLIQRLTQNIVLLFDGDAAGQRAALRGVDMILSQGMNVKVCTFPEGEDPDSFAKAHSLEVITSFLTENALDFLQFKAQLLLQDAAQDPIKKAATIKAMVDSIACIPDAIQREVYVQSCAATMEVSEEVLFSAIAQKLAVKGAKKQTPKGQQRGEHLKVVPAAVATPAVNQLYALEKQIISQLMIYGHLEERFVETVMTFSEEQNAIEEKEQDVTLRVHEKIFLDLQQDEVELAHPDFKTLYGLLMSHFQQSNQVSLETIIPALSPELSALVSSIVMDDEKYALHKWDKKNIFVKEKKDSVGQMITETILSLRKYLVDKKIEALQEEIQQATATDQGLLEDVMSYHQLRQLVATRLNRVL